VIPKVVTEFLGIKPGDVVVWVIRRLFGIENSVDGGKKFLGFPNLRVLEVRRSTVFKAQELVEEYRVNH